MNWTENLLLHQNYCYFGVNPLLGSKKKLKNIIFPILIYAYISE